jgi:RNA polymerase sigma-70 factor, ECF subfamily
MASEPSSDTMSAQVDEQAFLQAYDELADPLFRLCYFRLYDRELALDAVQESFKKVWIYIQKGKKVKNLKALLYQTTRNHIVDTARKQKHRNHLPLEELTAAGQEPGSTEHEQIMVNAELSQVRSLMDELDAQYREIFLLRHVEEYSPKEIAELLGLSPNVVSVRLHRAAKQIQTLATKNI